MNSNERMIEAYNKFNEYFKRFITITSNKNNQTDKNLFDFQNEFVHTYFFEYFETICYYIDDWCQHLLSGPEKVEIHILIDFLNMFINQSYIDFLQSLLKSSFNDNKELIEFYSINGLRLYQLKFFICNIESKHLIRFQESIEHTVENQTQLELNSKLEKLMKDLIDESKQAVKNILLIMKKIDCKKLKELNNELVPELRVNNII